MNATSAVSVAFDPLLGWPVLAGLGFVGLVLVLLGLSAGARGTLWRLGSLVVVLAALANPSLIEEQRKPIADVALVVIDDSDSMAIGERRQQVSCHRKVIWVRKGIGHVGAPLLFWLVYLVIGNAWAKLSARILCLACHNVNILRGARRPWRFFLQDWMGLRWDCCSCWQVLPDLSIPWWVAAG